ncbi:MAG: PAS domain S-box protein, partial [Gammaproteobacteria bacterium]
ILGAAVVFVAVFSDESKTTLRTLGAVLDQKVLREFEYPLEGSPCARVVGHAFRYVARGVSAEFPPGTIFGAKGMDAYAAFPLNDAAGTPLGLLAAMDRQPIADSTLAEALLKIFAGRITAEIERGRADAARAAAEAARQRTLDALQRSEASYRAIFEAAEDAIFIHDWDTGAVLDVNPKACAMYGYSYDELRRISIADISSGIPPYTAEQALRHLMLVKDGRCPPFEWHRRNKDGSLHWDEVRLKAVTIGGKPHILAFTRDITDHKTALESLRGREEQYRAIWDGSADAMALWNRDLRIVDVNRAFTSMLGYEREDVIGKSFGRQLSQDASERRVELIRAALDGDEGLMEADGVRKDGSRFEIELRYLPITHAGEPHVLAVGRDIGERRRRERELRASEAQYRGIFNASADALVLRDADFRIVDVNATYESMSGYTRDEVIGVDRVFANPVEVVPAIRALHRRALAGEPIVLETQLMRRDGACYDLELRGVPVLHGGQPHVLYMGRDITERRQAERQRADLERQLGQAQKMEAIGQLTGGIAHDFNNILTSVIGYVVLGQERAEVLGDATLQRQLGQVHLAAQRARDLIAQMLAFARRQRGERRVLSLAPLVRQSVQLLRATMPSSIVLDALELDADPEEATPLVEADAVQLEQVLFNLCINARDATGGTGHIRLALREAGGGWRCSSCGARVDAGHWVEMSVTDDGAGIAPDVLERMFEPFFSTKDVGRGSGMGLAMVHGIVHDHFGHVRVNTQPGRGTSFRVMLPAAETGDATGAAPPGPVADSAAPLRGRVMLVEDEPMVGDFMAELLRGWGLDVVLQRDPVAAVGWLDDAANGLDVVITDQTMPRMTGIELAQQVILRRPGLPVLLYTGDAGLVDAPALAHQGVRSVMRKPIDPAALRTLMRRWLDERRPAAMA